MADTHPPLSIADTSERSMVVAGPLDSRVVRLREFSAKDLFTTSSHSDVRSMNLTEEAMVLEGSLTTVSLPQIDRSFTSMFTPFTGVLTSDRYDPVQDVQKNSSKRRL